MAAGKRLLVLRHAKSSWDDPGLDDHERPLAPRGRRAVELLAEHVRAHGIGEGQVLCSSSRRTCETLAGLGLTGECLIERELYTASDHDVLERLRRVPQEVDSVMVIGHNPAMRTLVLLLAGASGRAEEAQLARIQHKFPTGALATMTFECGWRELAPGCAQLVAFVRPKALGQS